MQTLPVTEAKTHLSALVDEVASTHDRVMLTRHGRPAAMLVAVEELTELEETLVWLNSPGTLSRVAAADADFMAGRTMTTQEMLEASRA